MTMWVVQAHRGGRWAAWGLQGLDLVIQRSRMGAVPGCTRAGLPMVAGRGSKVRRKLDKGDKPRKWSTKRSARVCGRCMEGALRVHKGAQRCASSHLSQLVTGCVTCHTSHGCVTHFRPILGNLVEVTLVTSPFMYIVSHTKGTSFP